VQKLIFVHDKNTHDCTVKPPFNEDCGIMNDILHLSNSKLYGKEPDILKLDYSEHLSPVPWSFVKSKFHCITG